MSVRANDPFDDDETVELTLDDELALVPKLICEMGDWLDITAALEVAAKELGECNRNLAATLVGAVLNRLKTYRQNAEE